MCVYVRACVRACVSVCVRTRVRQVLDSASAEVGQNRRDWALPGVEAALGLREVQHSRPSGALGLGLGQPASQGTEEERRVL